ncbi:DUF262 domain-containing protein [Entomospira culicis]|uniref:DUF262 domain-containing protein n=1 Tax=Entomospira culicis TaxID=2719989 RepID=A0A968KTZ0_9SPIO|nr:DUF262 domain-containing protein [Entomospira culicis]NIZ18414.1 DUF262 domain-containing protein [Entomospira culicis]NIZ68630.1 DUF262 domain-containing protein [Entomospira culicis]WDI37230.1 DUF262 domain-containing HNH endonuclease family protein [Entomospira culicis]WDI38858.1 DUF262 domain-containing HNH endonuclease family protein [Entomospira culicis]
MTTLSDLVNCYDQLIVPDFQRAYSWDKKHYTRFLKDIEEALDDSRAGIATKGIPYYYGHFLMLKESGRNDGQMIDGQQRLTTVALFLASIHRHNLSAKTVSFIQKFLDKFHTVAYDQEFFSSLIKVKDVDAKELKVRETTLSAERLSAAYRYFSKQLQERESTEIDTMVAVLASAQVTIHEIENLIEATHIFTFQNDRGKVLTELEKVKAFVAFQYYRNGADFVRLKRFYDRFTNIYQNIEKIRIGVNVEENLEDSDGSDKLAKLGLNEDQVLYACLDAFYFHFEKNKRSFEEHFSDAVGKSLKNDKVAIMEYLDTFTAHLEKAFKTLLDFSDYLKDEGQFSVAKSVTILSKGESFYPFFFLQNELEPFNKNKISFAYQQLFFAFEQLLVRVNCVNHSKRFEHGFLRDWMRWWLDSKEHHGSVAEYMWHFLNRLYINSFEVEGEWQHPYALGESVVYEKLLRRPHGSIVYYILWRWELQLRAEQGLELIRWEDMPKSIEHIAPQSLNRNLEIEGYSFWSDINFDKEKDLEVFYDRLYGWGNLTLVAKSLNSELSNKSFKEKQECVQACITKDNHPSLAQYHGVFVEYNKRRSWKRSALEDRQKQIVDFITHSYLNWMVWKEYYNPEEMPS